MSDHVPSAPSIGAFIVPDATDPTATLGQIVAADESGLDLVALQDHPYQRRFFDTWTLLSFAAARTERIKLVTDVANLPLRPPAVLAKSAASLDVLSGGRVELGLGAGGFWDAIVAAGGPRRTPKEAVDALVEAIGILRDSWDGTGAVNRSGSHYDIRGFHPGPPPAHRIGIWLGAYGPRMLRVTGRLADGWLPSLGDHLSQEDALLGQEVIDEAARAAGRSPDEVIRAVNVTASSADPSRIVEQLVQIIEDLRFETVLVGVPGNDPIPFVRRLGDEVAPAVRARFS
jgi:alkanesulfonate monooxygenase SsuD/methylene tetrahydromethanopterin reductase-like flavin-dependent oxidoreductase (luciferase family)